MADLTVYFKCIRVNKTTFCIVESDKYDEHPFIYIKIYDDLLVISDTGCGGPDHHSKEQSSGSLRTFIETIPVAENDRKPLNPVDKSGKAQKKYLVICTHCHYDHILGLKHFGDASILASSYDKSFILQDLPEHSLCSSLKVPVPDYTVSRWADDLENIAVDGFPLYIQILHTPGHTPDELAWYDTHERHLYVGDSFYERVAADGSYEQAILFPKEGNLIHYQQSLDKLLAFVDQKNAEEPDKPEIRVGCGHITSSVPGREITIQVKKLFEDIIAGNVPVVEKTEKRGEAFVTWREDGKPRFSVSAPARLVEDAGKATDSWLDIG